MNFQKTKLAGKITGYLTIICELFLNWKQQLKSYFVLNSIITQHFMIGIATASRVAGVYNEENNPQANSTARQRQI